MSDTTKSTRRSFLAAGAGMVSAAVLSGQPNQKFPTDPRERIAVASYPFRDFINKPGGVDLLDFAQMVIDRYNIHNIEPLSWHFKSTEPAYIADLRRRVEKAGSHVVNIPCDVSPSLGAADAAGQKAIAVAKKWVDVAVELNSPSIRAHIARIKNEQPDVNRTADQLNAVVDYASFKGVVVNLENDDPKSEAPAFILEVLKKLDNPYARSLPDFCNSRLIGDDQFNYDAMASLFPYAYNISHMKDSESDGKTWYRTDPAKIFAIARKAGYRGWFSMEFEGEGDPYTGTQKLIDQSLKEM